MILRNLIGKHPGRRAWRDRASRPWPSVERSRRLLLEPLEGLALPSTGLLADMPAPLLVIAPQNSTRRRYHA